MKYLLALLAVTVYGQTIPLKAVWYDPYRLSFLAELADTTCKPAPCITPRQAAIDSMDAAFRVIANTLHANAGVIVLADEDSEWSQFGAALSWDPRHRPTPQQSVGQEIILAIAQKWNLRVVFILSFSGYHVLVDEAYGADPQSPGAWDFIHAAIDPAAYYGKLCTTDLPRVGLPDSCLGGYFQDPRIAGWLFGGEWCASADCADGTANVPNIPARHQHFLGYWPFFYMLVHWNGSTTSFAGVYALLSPADNQAAWQPRIDALKAVSPTPDLMGVEWYGNGSYDLRNAQSALQTMTGYLVNDAPPDAAAAGTGGMFAWALDGYGNGSGHCSVNLTSDFDLMSVSASPVLCRNYPAPRLGWHWLCGHVGLTNANSWCLADTSFNAEVNRVTPGELTAAGHSLAAAFDVC